MLGPHFEAPRLSAKQISESSSCLSQLDALFWMAEQFPDLPALVPMPADFSRSLLCAR